MQWEASTSGEDAAPEIRNAGFSTAPAERLYAPVIDAPPYHPEQVSVAAQQADPDSLWHTIRTMISVRKAHRALMNGEFRWADAQNHAVAAYWRESPTQRVLVCNNLSDRIQSLTVSLSLDFAGEPDWILQKDVMLCNSEVDASGERIFHFELQPYGYGWLAV